MEAAVDDFLKEINELAPTNTFTNAVEIPAVESANPPTPLQPLIGKNLHDYQVSGTSWTPCFDHNTGCPYYWNHLTNQVSWQPPPEYIAAVQAARNRQKEASQRGVVATKQPLEATPKQSKDKLKPKYPWEAESDSEDEKIELITSFGPQSGDDSEDEKIKTNSKKSKLKAASVPIKSSVVGGSQLSTKTAPIGRRLPSKTATVIGPQLPTFSETKPVPEDVNEVYETSSLLTPLVVDQGPPGAENVPDSSTKSLVDKKAKNKPASPNLSDDEDILCRLKSKAKILEKMGGEVPVRVKELLVPTSSKESVKVKKSKQNKSSAPSTSSFALIANYGDDSDSEEQTPVRNQAEQKPLFPSAVNPEVKPTTSVKIVAEGKPLFPIAVSDVQPSTFKAGTDEVSIASPTPTTTHIFACMADESADNQDEDFKALMEDSDAGILKDPVQASVSDESPFSELPDSTTTHKAFQRKRRIEFDRPVKEVPIVKYTMDPTTGEHRGFGFRRGSFDLPVEQSEKSAPGGSINFVKGETINFQPSKKIENSHCNASSELKTPLNVEQTDAGEIEEIAGILKEKLLFLEEGNKEVSAVQLMAIQLETLVNAWQQGALTPAYLSQWLSSRSGELCKHEQSAAPTGWTCAWDRQKKRYAYKNAASGSVVWDYPETATNVEVNDEVEAEQIEEEQEEIAMELSETPPRASSAPPTPEPQESEPIPPPPPVISPSRSSTPPPPPPPMISAKTVSTTEVSSSTAGLERLQDYSSALDEPLPPGVDDVEINVQPPCPPPPGLESRDYSFPPLPSDYRPPPPPPPPPDAPEITPSVVSSSNGISRKRSLLSELDSFYSDIAMLENDDVTTSEQPPLPSSEASGSTTPTRQTAPMPPAQSTSREDAAPVKKKKKISKLTKGLALKKKGFSHLVAKWEKVQKEARDSDDDDDVSSTL